MPKSFLNQQGLPRGLRNNNPGNIRVGDNWQGMIGQDGGFVVFENILYGIRAMATDLGNDMKGKGLNTISKLITEYAPPSENDTAAYIASMVRYTGFGANQYLPPRRDVLMRFIRGSMNVELGESYSALVTDSDINDGVSMMNDTLLAFFNIVPASSSGMLLSAAVAAIASLLAGRAFKN